MRKKVILHPRKKFSNNNFYLVVHQKTFITHDSTVRKRISNVTWKMDSNNRRRVVNMIKCSKIYLTCWWKLRKPKKMMVDIYKRVNYIYLTSSFYKNYTPLFLIWNNKDLPLDCYTISITYPVLTRWWKLVSLANSIYHPTSQYALMLTSYILFP